MAALEYLTTNSLTAYPFKARRAVGVGCLHPIEDDWFYDISFISFSPDIRSVYISKVKKTTLGELEITFSNTETSAVVATATVASSYVVNHYKNIDKSFASYSSASCAVKFIFGPGIIAKSDFTQEYTSDETSLSNAATILSSPRINTLNFETYSYDPVSPQVPTLDTLISYSYPEVPTVQPRYNSEFVLDAANRGSLYITRGAGAGLYDACPPADAVAEVFSINTIQPNTAGALFLNTSSCYTANVLTSSNETLYGAYLDKYRAFQVYTAPTTTDVVDVVQVGHAIAFENFCKPKCPHENLNAYAHYLNRVADGVRELDSIVSRSVETRGQGTSELKVFTATDFCIAGDDVFLRCSDISDSYTYVDCGGEFVKNYHEGRTLQLYYDNLTVRNYTIAEVINSHNVRLTSIPPPTQTEAPLSFRILDNGVISNLNCAALAYNQKAASFLKVYYEVTYSTNESYNADNVYSTNLAVVVAVYNPSPSVAQVQIAFTPTVLEQISGFKVRTIDSIYTLTEPELTLGCREYAFIETIYSIPCATIGGLLDISVFEKVGVVWTMVGDTYSLPEIIGADCPGGGTGGSGGATKLRATQPHTDTFNHTISLPGTSGISDLFGEKPEWLTYNYSNYELQLGSTGASSLASSRRYNLYFKTLGSASAIWQLIIDYVALPGILAPLGARFSSSTPLILSKENIYTLESPVFQVTATNMAVTSTDFNDSELTYYYTATVEDLPEGLSFDSAQGKLTGQLADTISPGATFELTVSAFNPAGETSNPQTITMAVAVETPPVIALIAPPADAIYLTDNLTLYTSASPLVAFSVINTPIYSYTLLGVLPPGLVFDSVTGIITGRITATVAASCELHIHTENLYGLSNTESFVLTYSIYSRPIISYPTALEILDINVADETTAFSPLLTIDALQAYGGTDNYAAGLTDDTRNYYIAAGVPPGFTLDLYTGKLYGKLSSSELPTSTTPYTLPYTVRLGAYNPIGKDTRNILINFHSSQAPTINNIAAGSHLQLIKEKTYSANSPLFKIKAINAPDTITVTGLPTGLTCTTGGALIGTVLSSVAAGSYEIIITAENALGVSPSVTCYIDVPISLISPANGDIFDLTVNQTQSNIFTAQACDVLPGDSAVITISTLPTGFTAVDNSVSGGSNRISSQLIRITATTANYGTATVLVTLAVHTMTYTVAGTVKDGSGSPVEGVLLTDGRSRTTLTDPDGKYTLVGLSTGGYNILASKLSYTTIPSFQQVQIGVANATGIDFIAETATRLITGTILTSAGVAVRGVKVSDGTHEASTDSFGVYELYIFGSEAKAITPSSLLYVFDPPSGTVPAGTEGLSGANFEALDAHVASAPTITGLASSDTSLIAAFTAPTDDGGTEVTNYRYSTDFGVTWLTLSPAQTTGAITVALDTATSSPLTNGVSYGVKLQAVTQAGYGVGSLTVLGTPATGPSAPIIDRHTVTAIGANVYFTAPTSNGGELITSYEYSIDSGVTYLPINAITSPLFIELTSGEAYILTLRAITTKGTGDVSLPYALFMATIPDAPTISSVTPEDTQLTVYFNTAENTGGVPLSDVAYSVDNGFSYTSRVPVSITSPITITNLINGRQYFITLRAINNVGNYSVGSTTVLATPAIPPGKPTSLSIVPSNAALTVSFTAPTAVTSILNYKYQLDAADWVALSPTRVGSPIAITGLSNGTSYTVRLKAVVDAGDGEASDSITGTPGKPPTAPTISNITSGDQSLLVTYTAPVDLGGLAITEYRYTINSGATYLLADGASLSSPTGSFTIPSLVNGTAYSVKLKAKNSTGSSVASVAYSGTPAGQAPAPVILNTQAYDKRISVRLTSPILLAGGTLVRYEYSLNSGAWVAAGTSLPLSITTLDGSVVLSNQTSYSIRVRLVTSAGAGLASAAVVGKTWGVPEAPVVTDISSGGRYLTISFDPPDNTGGPDILNYAASFDNGASWLTRSPASADSPWQVNTLADGITRLTYGVEYSVVIRAINSIGAGTTSNTLTGTPMAPPSAPTINTITAADTILQIAFTAPQYNYGLPVLNYEYSLDGGLTWRARTDAPITTSSPLIITKLVASPEANLENGTAYAVRIRALSSAGAGASSATVTGTPVGAPDAPILLSVTPVDQGLLVSFTPPVNMGGSTIANYAYSLDGGTTQTFASGPTSPITISNLVNGLAYPVKLYAFTAAGVLSLPTSTLTGIPGTPSAPMIDRILPGDGKAYIYFTTQSSNGAAITDYEYTVDGGAATLAGGTTSPITVTGLQNGQSYNLSLAALNTYGTGPAATSAATPGLLSSPVISSIFIDTSQIKLYFNTQNSSEVGVTDYEYSLDGSDYTSSNSNQSPLTIQGLQNRKSYTVVFRGVNSQGSGAPSELKTITVGAPSAPYLDGVGAVGINNGQMLIYYTPPDCLGEGTITNYQYSLNGGTSFITPSPADIYSPLKVTSGISAGSTYKVVLRAVNSAGAGVVSDVVSYTAGGSIVPTITEIVPYSGPGNYHALALPQFMWTKEDFVVVKFSPPDNHGRLQLLTYQYSVDDGATWQDRLISEEPLSSSLKVTGLSAEAVKLRLRAVYLNNVYGGWSAMVPCAASIPSIPSLVGVYTSQRMYVVKFMPPTYTGGRTITGYAAFEGNLESTGEYVVFNTDTIPHTFTRFFPSTIYGYPTTVNPINIYARFSGDTDSYTVGISDLAKLYRYELATTYQLQSSQTPPSPVGISVTPGYGSAVVSFSTPQDLGDPITYDSSSPDPAVTYYEYSLNGNVDTTLVPGSSTSVRLTGLVPGKPVTIKARALNAYGTGEYSQPLTINISNAAIAVPAPYNVTVVPVGSSLTISASKPTLPAGVTMTGYEYSLDNGISWVFTAGTGNLSLSLTNLAGGSRYLKLRVVVASGNGVGEETKALLITLQDTTPKTPEAFYSTYVVQDRDCFTLNEAQDGYIFVAPPSTSNSATIVAYDVFDVEAFAIYTGYGLEQYHMTTEVINSDLFDTLFHQNSSDPGYPQPTWGGTPTFTHTTSLTPVFPEDIDSFAPIENWWLIRVPNVITLDYPPKLFKIRARNSVGEVGPWTREFYLGGGSTGTPC